MHIGFIIHTNHHITDLGPLIEEYKKKGHCKILLFVNKNIHFKPEYNPFLHQEHLRLLPFHELFWYDGNEELATLLTQHAVSAVFTEEAYPFVESPELFKKRTYKIYSIVHSVDNFHPRARQAGVIDTSIVAHQQYGIYLGWNEKDYVALGLPKYDIISTLNAKKIQKKYTLPSKFILVLVPNNPLLSIAMVFRIVRRIKKVGYAVVLKGKKPKCHRPIFYFFGKYFLNDISYYPFITHELIVASSGVVGFDTTAIEEILMCKRPIVNFSIKPYRKREAETGNFKQFVPMWNSDFCLDIPFLDAQKFGLWKKLPKFVHHFAKKDIDYEHIQREVFSIPGGASEKVINFVDKDLYS